MRRFAEHFGLVERIRFEARVVHVERCNGGGGYDVTHQRGGGDGGGDGEAATEQFDAVAVCSGAHMTPLIPAASLAGFGGEVLHSSAYKERAQLRGRRVLVVGSQETAMDIGFRAVKAPAAAVAMVVRRGFLSVPHLLGGEPLDTLITNAFEHTWQHEWVERLRVKWCVAVVAVVAPPSSRPSSVFFESPRRRPPRHAARDTTPRPSGGRNEEPIMIDRPPGHTTRDAETKH